jgi:hypothetical protein
MRTASPRTRARRASGRFCAGVRDGRRRHARRGARDQRIEPGRRDVAVQVAVDHDGRRARTVAQAIHRLERDRTVGRRAVEIGLQASFHMLLQRLPVHGLAGLRTAHLHHPAPGRSAAEVGVEGDDAMHFRPGQVQRLGNDGNGGGWDESEIVLHRMQQRQ